MVGQHGGQKDELGEKLATTNFLLRCFRDDVYQDGSLEHNLEAW